MYCIKCGNKLKEGARFCTNCGIEVGNIGEGNSIQKKIEYSSVEPERKKKKTCDGIIDAISSKITGKNIETIRVSMEDMLVILNKYFISLAITDADYKEIQKTVNGGKIGIKNLESKDGNYYMSVSIVMQLAGKMDIFHPSDSNWIRVHEKSTGKVYQYSSFTWRKFKKAVKHEIDIAKK